MKKNILFAFLLLNLNLLAQSKKEIIQTLKTQIDSLNLEIKTRDIKFEKEQATTNTNKELTLLTISKLENNLVSLKEQFDSNKKNNEQLQESITQLKSKLLVLSDSIVILKKENKLASSFSSLPSDDFNKKVRIAFEKIKKVYTDNMIDNCSVEKDIIKDSYNVVCDNECVSFVLTEQILVMSYFVYGSAFMGTIIIDLNSGKVDDIYASVSGFDKEKSILEIETNGTDNDGRRWFKSGSYNLKTRISQWGKKGY